MDYQQREAFKQKSIIAGISAVAGGIAWWIILANVLGWVSPTTAQQHTSDAVQAKVDHVLAPFCADRFMANKDALAKFSKATADYDRTELVQNTIAKIGATTMDYQLADSCTNVIAARLKTASPHVAQDTAKKS
jgi:hypothetical protein